METIEFELREIHNFDRGDIERWIHNNRYKPVKRVTNRVRYEIMKLFVEDGKITERDTVLFNHPEFRSKYLTRKMPKNKIELIRKEIYSQKRINCYFGK